MMRCSTTADIFKHPKDIRMVHYNPLPASDISDQRKFVVVVDRG